MTEERKYIYSIIKNPKGIQTSDSFRLSEVVSGINNREIIFIPYRDVAATVSNIHLFDFDKLDKKEFAHLVAMHERVNSDLMKKQEVIPMRFGMIALTTEEIRNILAKTYIQLKTTLERIAGKAEFVIQVFWNEKKILEKIVQENTEIQELKKETELKGKILGLPSKMKLGKRVFETIESCRREYAKDVLGSLAAHFPEFSFGKLLNGKERGPHEGGKEMIMNHSFLVRKTEESALESILSQLAERYKDELKFKYIGPMAPYSFATVNLSLENFDLIDNARKTLGLGESVIFPEIKKAYHRLATQYHPDKYAFTKNRATLEEAEKKMKDIITAHEILTVYCGHYFSALSPGIEQTYSFKKEDVENSATIKEKHLA